MKHASFIEDWIEEGVEKGLQQGEKRGLQKGVVQSILQVLITRFDPSARAIKPVEQQLETLESLPLLQKLLNEAVLAETLAAFAGKLEHLVKQDESAATDPGYPSSTGEGS